MTAADQHTAEPNVKRPALSFPDALRLFAKIGLFSFGGPAGQIALMHKCFVDEHQLVTEQQYLHALNFCMLLPGPEAMQLATYIGWKTHGTKGGVAAGLLFVLPGLCVMVLLSALYVQFGSLDLMQGLLMALNAAVMAIVVQALIKLTQRVANTAFNIGLAIASFVALFLFSLPFPLVIFCAFVLGVAFHAMAESTADTIEPEAAQKTHSNSHLGAVKTLAFWLCVWALPLALIVPLSGSQSVFADMFWFFSQMAIVTFGGAYAVLAYVAQQGVSAFGWLTPEQMVDGLGLAETTPGPLVLVLSFVGFMGAASQASGLPPLLAGILGALLTAWVTFAPCFLWIFLGAPYMQKLQDNARLSAGFAAVTAAIVGVIANLSLWFGLNILFDQTESVQWGMFKSTLPQWTSVNLLMAVLIVIAMALIFGLKRGLLTTLGIMALLGLAAQSLAV